MAHAGSDPRTTMLLSLTRLTAHWNSLEYQRSVTRESGVELDSTAVRAVYLLGISGGSIRPSELASELNLSRPSTSKLLARLEAAGLVERVRDEGDGRATAVTLRPGGEEAFTHLFAAGIEKITAATSGWDARDTERLADLLPRFITGLIAGAPATD